MSEQNLGQCQTKLGTRDSDVCYKKAGHLGNCYKSVGLEAEAMIREVLSLAGHKAVKASIHEDHIRKVDFWVECSNEECPLIFRDKEFVPIQFTIDREAAFGRKGQEAIRNGTIIVYISWEELMGWHNCSDAYEKQRLCSKIAGEFMDTIKKVTTFFPSLKLQTPATNLIRFEQ